MASVAATGRADLTDAQWAVLEPLLPVGRKPGRPPKWTKRQLINGIRWRVRVGSPWRDIPPAYGCWQTVYGLFRRWQRAGVWAVTMAAVMMAGLQARADAAGLITWDVSVDSTINRAHQHAAGARNDSDRQKQPPGGVGEPEPADHALGRSRGGWTTKLHLAVEQGQKPVSLLVTASQHGPARGQSPVRGGAGRYPHRPRRWGTASDPAGSGPGGQGLQRSGQPGLSAAARDRVHDPPACRPTPASPQPRACRWPATGVRPGDLQAATCGGVRHQPAQTQPGCRHAVRQTRRSLRDHSPHRGHQRVATAFETPPSRGPRRQSGASMSVFHLAFSRRG